MNKSVTVVLDKLPKKETTLIIEFLQAEIDGRFRFVGSKVQVEGTEKKDLKRLLNKFLHSRRLGSYRTVSNQNVLEIVPVRARRPTRKEPPVSPPSSYFLPLSKVPGRLGWDPEDVVPALRSKRRVKNPRTEL